MTLIGNCRNLLLGSIVLVSACSKSNILILGRVQAEVGGHEVTVTDCYRTSVPPPETLNGPAGMAYHYAPCRDADITIRTTQLTVNGVSYGPLAPGDKILVDHGVVKINDQQAGLSR